jgi:hypothetical protein
MVGVKQRWGAAAATVAEWLSGIERPHCEQLRSTRCSGRNACAEVRPVAILAQATYGSVPVSEFVAPPVASGLSLLSAVVAAEQSPGRTTTFQQRGAFCQHYPSTLITKMRRSVPRDGHAYGGTTVYSGDMMYLCFRALPSWLHL